MKPFGDRLIASDRSAAADDARGRPQSVSPDSGPAKHEAVDAEAAPHSDWSTSLHFVRDVAERVREAQHKSSVAAGEARQAARNAIVAMWAAEKRAVQAEAHAAAALVRAQEAEDQLRLLRSQMEPVAPAVNSVDRWLDEAYRQLRLASEVRPDTTAR